MSHAKRYEFLLDYGEHINMCRHKKLGSFYLDNINKIEYKQNMFEERIYKK